MRISSGLNMAGPSYNMKLLWIVMSVAVFSALLASCKAPSGSVFKTEYTMQVTVGSTTFWGMGAAKFAELAAQKTGGRINVKPYYGSQLLKGAQLNSAQMVATGAIDCAFESTINAAPVIPEMNLFSLPFFINTYKNVDCLEQGDTGRLLFEKMLAKGLQPLAWGENGFRQLTNSKHAVAVPGDLHGLRVRVVGSPIFIDIFRELGADPVNMNWGDAISAFQQGTVDGQENPVGILLPVQIHQYHQYATFWNYVIDPLILYWNKKQWDAFPDDIQKALREAAVEATLFEKSLSRAGLDDGTAITTLKNQFNYEALVRDPQQLLRSKGMEIAAMNDAQLRSFQQVLSPVVQKWQAKIGENLIATAINDMNGNSTSGDGK